MVFTSFAIFHILGFDKKLIIAQVECLANGGDKILGQSAATLEHIAGAPFVHIFGHKRYKIQCVLYNTKPRNNVSELPNEFLAPPTKPH